LNFEELKSLDLRQSRSVGEIVDAMTYCAFGARMLGEVARTMHQMIGAAKKPVIVYDGHADSPLGRLLQNFVKKKWCARIVSPAEYGRRPSGENVIVVGAYSERYEDALYRKPARALFINQFDMARPGQIKEGFYPDAVFADPRYIMPVIRRALGEWIDGERATVDVLIKDLPGYGGVAAQVARGADALERMARDKACLRFLTVTGAMTVGKMDLIICDMIESGLIHAISSTGALMAHGLVASIGLKHYKYDPKFSDTELARRKLNRVTDTLEPESNLDTVEAIIGKVIADLDGAEPLSPTELNSFIGKHLVDNYPGERGILKSAYEHSVPVFVPAFVDSELGNDIYIHNLKRRQQGKRPIFIDLERDSRKLIELVTSAKRFGIFTIGGGVPRNNVQNVAPLIEIINERLDAGLPERRYTYGIRICPDRPHFGHLSGCTYSENESWRKAVKNGVYAEIQADATQVWPFLAKYVLDKINSKARKPKAELRPAF
jgi:deoxyhypusine synthase